MSIKYAVFKTGFKVIAAAGADRWLRTVAQGSGLILMFHHVRPRSEYVFDANRLLEVTPEFVEYVLAELWREGFEIVPLDAVPERLRAGRSSCPFVVLTFDDGYRDNVEYAWPVLKRYGAPWTLFVTTDFANGSGRLWWVELEWAISRLKHVTVVAGGKTLELPARTPREKNSAFAALFGLLRVSPEDQSKAIIAELVTQADVRSECLASELCLSWDELRSLAREPDVTIGAHTLTHPMLAKQQIAVAQGEIVESKSLLEQRLGCPVRHFAYPGGDAMCAGPREYSLAKQAGFVSAVTTRPGHLFAEHVNHLHALPRVSVNGLFQTRSALRALLSGVPFWAWNRARKVVVASH